MLMVHAIAELWSNSGSASLSLLLGAYKAAERASEFLGRAFGALMMPALGLTDCLTAWLIRCLAACLSRSGGSEVLAALKMPA